LGNTREWQPMPGYSQWRRFEDAIKVCKGIPAKASLMDRMGTTELSANQFRT
jgi:hypothetical protein